MAGLSEQSRIGYEYKWSDHDARQHLPAPAKSLWKTFGYSSRTFVHVHKKYVVWRSVGGVAQVLDVLRMHEAGLSAQEGLSVIFRRRDGSYFTATSTPSKPTGLDVFFWLPGISDLRWAPMEWDDPSTPRLLRVGVNFKQMKNLAHGLSEGVHYLSEIGEFIRTNPAFATTVF